MGKFGACLVKMGDPEVWMATGARGMCWRRSWPQCDLLLSAGNQLLREFYV